MSVCLSIRIYPTKPTITQSNPTERVVFVCISINEGIVKMQTPMSISIMPIFLRNCFIVYLPKVNYFCKKYNT